MRPCRPLIAVAWLLGSLAAAAPTFAQPARLEVLTSTGASRDELPVLAPHPSPSETVVVLERGFSGRLLHLYALEQEYLRRKTGITPEPAYLLLSERQGGFPQFGFYLNETKKANVGWVDLHKSSRLSGRFGATDQVFPHELMHVIMRQLAGEPRESGGNQVHAIGVRTDPVNAFTEGFAEAMQILAVDDADAVPETRALATNAAMKAQAEADFARYARDLRRRWWPIQPSRLRFLLWFNSAEQVLRYHGVRANQFARPTNVPDLGNSDDAYDAYLLTNVVPGDAHRIVNSPSVMLSSEGVVSHLVWRLITDTALQQRRSDAAFYAQFGVTSESVTPLDNIFLKIFAALHDGRPSTAAELVRALTKLFPADAADIDRVTREALFGQPLPDAPELWLRNDALMTGTSLFDQYRALPRPHTFDANAATWLDWLSVPGVTREQAEALLAGAPYVSMAALQARAPAALQPRIVTMADAMKQLLARAADEEESLSLTTILLSYVWRLLGIIAVTTTLGALLARGAGARRLWSAALIALVASVLVIAFAWVINSPPWYPFAAPIALCGVPWMLWRVARRRPSALQPLLTWALAAVPALVIALV